jgi:hypothetical protein
MPTFREDPAAYMRARRAKQKAEAERAVALGGGSKPKGREAKRALPRAEREASSQTARREPIPIGRALTAEERADDVQLGAIEARGGIAEWTGKEWRERQPQRPTVLSTPRPIPSPAQAVQRYIPPAPKSMFAIGGKPGTERAVPGYDPAFAPHEPSAVAWNVNVATMLNALARQADEQKRRADEQERRIAALEVAAADSKVQLAGVMQGLFGFARAVLLGRACPDRIGSERRY